MLLTALRQFFFYKEYEGDDEICTVCLFLPTTAKDIPVSPVIS